MSASQDPMRALVVLPLLLLTAGSGCLDDTDFASAAGMDCSSQTTQLVAQNRSMLLPREPVETPYEEGGNLVRVHAREGQDVVAQATWNVAAGQAEVNFDGPSSHLVSTERTWQTYAYDVPAGNYTLEMSGAPIAFEAVFTLQLVASGCTPRE